MAHFHRSCEDDMAGVEIRASETLTLTGVGGVALVGNMLEKFTDFRASFTNTFHKGKGGIPWGDVLTAYVGSLATGKSDFEALRPWHGKAWMARALRISLVASPETVRQHLDNLADGHLEEALQLTGQASLDLLVRSKAPITPCMTSHVCMDVDNTPQDNGKTRKIGVSRTYMTDMFGFTPIFAYAGEEGWCINDEFRKGSQHGQNGAPAFLNASLTRLEMLTKAPILVRMDSAFDAGENYVLLDKRNSDFLVKGNSAHMQWQGWKAAAQALPASVWKRVGRNQRVVYLNRFEIRCG